MGNPDLPTTSHPRYLAAKAARDAAALDLERTSIRAPFEGIATKVPMLGQQATSGTPLLVVVSSSSPWIEANFKETDLTNVRPGQSASIRVDTYPGQVWNGHVDSISQATGSEFAVLPPQNASGNWVKVVQRIPVRIAVDMRPGDPPLRVGMSTFVEIDTRPTASLSSRGAKLRTTSSGFSGNTPDR
jgi:membrane fusion protein (multidrug efflux system)